MEIELRGNWDLINIAIAMEIEITIEIEIEIVVDFWNNSFEIESGFRLR
jgi:hypothetical protein